MTQTNQNKDYSWQWLDETLKANRAYELHVSEHLDDCRCKRMSHDDAMHTIQQKIEEIKEGEYMPGCADQQRKIDEHYIGKGEATGDLVERLAAIEHERWADWQKWCHKVLREQLNPNGCDNDLEDVLRRWDRQIGTPYSELSEAEKQSDRDQVMRYWPLVQQEAEQRCIEARIETAQQILDSIKAEDKHSGASWYRGYISAQYTLRKKVKQYIRQLSTNDKDTLERSE